VITRKGKGHGFAEEDPGNYHGITPPVKPAGTPGKTFTEAFGSALLDLAGRDSDRHYGGIVALTAAMELGTGLSLFRKTYPGRFFDVGIAEAHAVTFAAGLAAQGLRPVTAIYSTFIQRSVDQIIHDVALQNLPVLFALDRSGFVDGDGETHQGLFDIALFRTVPRMTILVPAGESEMRLMLDYALRLDGPAMIRYPKALCPVDIPAFSLPLEQGRGVWLRKASGSRICLAFTGGLYPQALDAAEQLKAAGHEADLYNLRFLKPIDEDYLVEQMNNYDLFAFIEEGLRCGGFGEYAATLARCDRQGRRHGRRQGRGAEILVLAVEEHFSADNCAIGTRDELLRDNKLDGTGITERILELIPTL